MTSPIHHPTVGAPGWNDSVQTALNGKADTGHSHAGSSPVSSVNGRVGAVTGLAEASASVANNDQRVTADQPASTASIRTLGTGATQAAAGNDTRLSDPRTPTVHAHPDRTDVIFAADYGWATGATATANDAAIANAIVAARVGSRRLYLGVGTYNISVPIDLRASPGNGVCIEMFGATRQTTVIVQTTPTADVLQVGGYAAHIRDMELRHTEAAFTASPTTLGAGLSMHKLSYGSVSRMQLTANGRGIYLADVDVFEPGTSAGVGNYFHSVSYTDCFILRYGVCGIQVDNDGDTSTGSSFRGVWIQNRSTSGTPIAPSLRALSLKTCDEMTFTQLNIEDYQGNTPILLNACGGIAFESLHFERANLSGGDPQYIRVAGGSQLVADVVSFAFSDIAMAGATGGTRLYSAVTGGKIDVRGTTYKNMGNTAVIPAAVVDLSDAEQGSTAEVSAPSGGDASELVMTLTALTNPGLLRLGDRLGAAAMPAALSRARPFTAGPATFATNAANNGNNIDITAVGALTLAVPVNPTNGQVLQYTILASGAEQIITLAAGLGRLSGITASYTVPVGKVLRLSTRFTALTSTWIVEAAAVTQ